MVEAKRVKKGKKKPKTKTLDPQDMAPQDMEPQQPMIDDWKFTTPGFGFTPGETPGATPDETSGATTASAATTNSGAATAN